MRKAGVDQEQIHKYRDRANRLANLQLLEGSTNTSKGAKLPTDWLRAEYSEEAGRNHCRLHDLGDIPTEVTGFLDFYETRRTRILEKLRRLLVPASTEDPDSHRPGARMADPARQGSLSSAKGR